MIGFDRAAKAHVFLGTPDLSQRLVIDIPQQVATDLLPAPIDGEVGIVMGKGVTRGDAAIPADHRRMILHKAAAALGAPVHAGDFTGGPGERLTW